MNVLRLVENLMPNLGVSQRPVVAERLQGAGADAQLLADILIVHPTAEPFIFYLVFVVNNPFRLQSKACVCIKQWLCNGLAACGSKWQGVALSTDQ